MEIVVYNPMVKAKEKLVITDYQKALDQAEFGKGAEMDIDGVKSKPKAINKYWENIYNALIKLKQ